MKTYSLCIYIGVAVLAGTITIAYGQHSSKTTATEKAAATATSAVAGQPSKNAMVGVFVTSVSRQIRYADLQKAYPSEQAGQIDRVKMAADTIVGWYDNGGNYHEQKMENNLGHFDGGVRVLPQTLRGVALRGSKLQQQP